MKRMGLLLFLFVAARVWGSVATGTIEGHVTLDGISVPGATVMVEGSAAEGSRRYTVTDAGGRFRFVQVAAGTWRVTVTLTGATPVSQTVTVQAGASVAVETAMKTTVAETITVTAALPAILETTEVGTNISVGGDVEAHPQYARIREHEYLVAREQPITTFSIDVDRASYANVRRFLAQHQAPPPDAVRIEELVNYFTYHLPQPEGRDPFAITTEVSGCPWNRNHRLLRIAMQGRNLDEWRMAPNNLVFLLDVSGSMDSPERLPLLVQAFHTLVDRLRAEDSVAIVVYAGAAGFVLPPTSGADKATILAALDKLDAGGSTAGAEGIELAYKVALDNFKKDGNNRVILATDGDFNVGINDLEALQKLIEEKRESGVDLTTIGVGDDNLQDATLELLADKGNGNYAYLDSLDEAKKVFGSELTGTLVTIAKDVKVQLVFNPETVRSYRQIGYENRALENKDFDDDTKDAGELGAGHTVTVLYEIVPTSPVARGEIATVRLRYKQPDARRSTLVVSRAVDEGNSAYNASPDMQLAAAVAEWGMLLRNSAYRGTASFQDVRQLAKIAQGEDLDGLRGEFLKLIEESARVVVMTTVISAASP